MVVPATATATSSVAVRPWVVAFISGNTAKPDIAAELFILDGPV